MSRGLGDVYKRQGLLFNTQVISTVPTDNPVTVPYALTVAIDGLLDVKV